MCNRKYIRITTDNTLCKNGDCMTALLLLEIVERKTSNSSEIKCITIFIFIQQYHFRFYALLMMETCYQNLRSGFQ